MCRLEHASFTEREKKTYEQLVRVTVQDFLPFVKQIFDSLFKLQPVESLALSTPYVLMHNLTRSLSTGTSGSVLSSSKLGVGLRMDLDVVGIGETLRSVAGNVFKEMEELRQQQLQEQTITSLAVKGQDGLNEGTTGKQAVEDADKTLGLVEHETDHSINLGSGQAADDSKTEANTTLQTGTKQSTGRNVLEQL